MFMETGAYQGSRDKEQRTTRITGFQRSRSILMQDRTAVSKHIRGLLLEPGIAIPKGFCHLHQAVPVIFDDEK